MCLEKMGLVFFAFVLENDYGCTSLVLFSIKSNDRGSIGGDIASGHRFRVGNAKGRWDGSWKGGMEGLAERKNGAMEM